MITIVVTGRNDDYGGDFGRRLSDVTTRNAALLAAAGLDHEFLFVEWNPLPNRPLLSRRFVAGTPRSRAIVVSPALHDCYSLNQSMPFFEMTAKNVGIRRATGEWILVTNGDIVLGGDVMAWLRHGRRRQDTFYRAHRVDVPRTATAREMRDPANHLVSGEGRLPPCAYLGAGGDFCLAHRSLWLALGGFDERIRFSTRGKDWQFFLNATTRGARVEFVGTVFHLDHADGFRNTPADQRDTETAHFGGPWDVEFGLPVSNPPDWGLQGRPEQIDVHDHRIRHVTPRPDEADRRALSTALQLRDWLARPSPWQAHLLHAILTAQERNARLRCRLRSTPTLVALSGLAAVARDFGVEVCCDYTWPPLPGMTPHPFTPEPAESRGDDLFLEEGPDAIRLGTAAGTPVPIEPKGVPIESPAFAPLMGRRLLRAYLRASQLHVRRIALFGAGRHTRDLLSWGVPDALKLEFILVSDDDAGRFVRGIPVRRIAQVDPGAVDAVLLSSASFEPEMHVRASAAGFDVLPLYGDWPADFWVPRVGAREFGHTPPTGLRYFVARNRDWATVSSFGQ